MSKPKVLIIGWDAADWKMFNPLLEKNELPAVQKMIDDGVMGNLATLQPVLSPMLWNSIATGKRPYKHGIYGFTEVNPHTNMVGPSLSTSRTCKAIWNMLSQEGYRTHVVNWFASHPAEPINGICISEMFSKTPKDWEKDWPLGNSAVQPPELKELVEGLRLHPKELDGQLIQMFAKHVDELDQKTNPQVRMLANLISEAITIHNGITHILEHEEWDFAAVYYGSIDHFSHGFMHYHPPQMPFVPDEEYRIFKDVIPNVIRFHDRMLERLVQLAGPDATIIVCSDHGFHSDHLRPLSTPAIPAGPAIWHRDQGMIMMTGPNIKRDELIHGATLLDITPTVLQMFGLPIGRDMDGRPLIESFVESSPPDVIETWENRKGEHPDGMHTEQTSVSQEQSQAVLDQFVALGYIDPPEEDNDKNVASAARELEWNLARSYIDGGLIPQAVELLEKIVDECPERRDFTLTLSNCLTYMGMEKEGRELALTVLDAADPKQFSSLLARAELRLYENDFDAALEILDKIELESVDFSSGGGGSMVSKYSVMGACFFRLGEMQRAVECFLMALEIDPDFPRAWLGIAKCYNRMDGQEEAAVDAALRSVELEHSLADGHFALGIALGRSGDEKRAVDAFNTVLQYVPNHLEAHRRISMIYKKLGGHDELVELHESSIEEIEAMNATEFPEEFVKAKEDLLARLTERVSRLRPFYIELEEKEKKDRDEAERKKTEEQKVEKEETLEPFVIVSGLPRSGTSLLMQMLDAGGLQPMTDGERQADVDNPEGYYEWEAIKKIKAHPELIHETKGKATKVISMLLPQLPRNQVYKMIFIFRPIDEIVRSQEKMIDRLGTKGAELDTEALKQSLTIHRREIVKAISQLPIQWLPVRYKMILARPDAVAKRIGNFLGKDVLPNPELMPSVVRQDLYRNRSETDPSDSSDEPK